MMNKNKLIGVLMGGWNSEKEVSLRSGEAVYQSLVKLGYENVEKIIFSRNIVDDLKRIKPDIVFNALHGQYGEDGRVQGLLDILQIPYTHSGLVASTICMDKFFTNQICQSIGVLVPKSVIIEKNNPKDCDIIKKPFVIKPISDGSSVGVEVILENNDFDLKNYHWKFGDKIMVEEYIAGKELEVAVIDNKAIGVLEVRPKKLFYDYECKYTAGMTDYIMPAEISAQNYDKAMQIAQKIHTHIGCEGISRAEFILNKNDGKIYFLEINTHPGFTATSLIPKIAAYKGISFEDIVQYLINTAKCAA